MCERSVGSCSLTLNRHVLNKDLICPCPWSHTVFSPKSANDSPHHYSIELMHDNIKKLLLKLPMVLTPLSNSLEYLAKNLSSNLFVGTALMLSPLVHEKPVNNEVMTYPFRESEDCLLTVDSRVAVLFKSIHFNIFVCHLRPACPFPDSERQATRKLH